MHASRDGGRTWDQRGDRGGEPEALAANDDQLHAAATGRGVLASADAGLTWTVRYSDTGGA